MSFTQHLRVINQTSCLGMSLTSVIIRIETFRVAKNDRVGIKLPAIHIQSFDMKMCLGLAFCLFKSISLSLYKKLVPIKNEK